jgi:DNA modification methylase
MANQKVRLKTEKELQEAILEEKARGTPDLEIGQKYGVTFRYIERLITKTQGLNVSALKVSKKVKKLYPKDFKEEQTTVWSFKQRGNWATHSGEYRGNWSPYIPRNVILKYSNPSELILDYFCGAGTTAVECKLLGRKCIAIDINNKAIELAKRNIDFNIGLQQLTFINEKSHLKIYEPELLVGDARNLSFLKDNSIDLICAHPPYANIIHYTDSKEGDLSFFDIDAFLKEMSKVAEESFRVLKPGRQCAILIGDTRRMKHVIPLGFKLINVYLDAGFKLQELVIKRQHNCKTTGFWYANSIKYNFLLLAHEYLPIFEKPVESLPLSVKVREIDNSLVVSTLEKLPLKRKLDEPETTTVWVLPEKDFEKRLNKNVINRYSEGKEYSTVTFVSHSKKETNFPEKNIQKKKQLLFIKSPCLNNNPSSSNIEYYLERIRKFVKQELPTLNKSGFLVIQTQDTRIDGYIEPLGKRIVDLLTLNNLWLKEIIIVTQERQNPKIDKSGKQLSITHQYLLVYEKTKRDKHV